MKIESQLVGTEQQDFNEGGIYTIFACERTDTVIRGFKGIRVGAKNDSNQEVSVMLWVRDVVGPKSKLGSFILVLGDNMDEWKGKTIRIDQWRPGQRQVSLLTQGKEKPKGGKQGE